MNPYDDIESMGLAVDNQTWHSSSAPIFEELIDELKPKTIIEVGSWKGVSAMVMARLGRPYDSHVHCVDTWLGDVYHLINGDKIPRDKWGGSQLYHQFLTNVKAAGLHDQITPYPMTSSDGARYLAHKGTTAQLIYIDGSHHMEDCYQDLKNFWPLLEKGGVMFGDDHLVFSGVFAAVIRFSCEMNLNFKTQDPHWIIRKP